MSGELSFFELGVANTEQGRKFYSALFGWEFESGPGGSGYSITTPNVPGGIHGGDAGAGPYVFFRVPDLDAAVEHVLALGGTIDAVDLGEDPESAAKFGRFKLCHDDQGSAFGLHEPPSGN